MCNLRLGRRADRNLVVAIGPAVVTGEVLGDALHAAIAHSLHEGADLGGVQRILAPRAVGFFHEGILVAAVLGRVEDRGKVQVDADAVEDGPDFLGEGTDGILGHLAHLLGARRACPFGRDDRDAVDETAFLVGGDERLDTHRIVDGTDVCRELVEVLEVIFHHQVTAELVFQHKVGRGHVDHHHLGGLLLDGKGFPKRHQVVGEPVGVRGDRVGAVGKRIERHEFRRGRLLRRRIHRNVRIHVRCRTRGSVRCGS